MPPEELKRQLEALHAASFSWAVSCCGGDRQEAEEVLQAVYLKILEGRARFGARSALKTWLFGVIRHTASGRFRRRSLRRALMLRWGRQELAPERMNEPGPRVEAESRSRAVRRAMAELSPRQRQVLELVFFHDLSVREAAQSMGVSSGTASLHYDRGKRRLVSLIEQEGWA